MRLAGRPVVPEPRARARESGTGTADRLERVDAARALATLVGITVNSAYNAIGGKFSSYISHDIDGKLTFHSSKIA